MKMKVSSRFVAGILILSLVLSMSTPVWAIPYDGVEFPQGNISFADRVVSFIPGDDTIDPYNNPQTTMGPPDYETTGDGTHLALGHGGILTIQFTNNYLIDVDGPDLYVFEIGPAVEAFQVEISVNGSNWIDLGTVSGQPTSLDINAYVNPGDKFSYVRVTDANARRSGRPYAGADIDAIGAIGAEEKEEEECIDAELVVLVGDIDNLGFGWPTGFDVFSGNSTPRHSYPWTPEADDPPGTDRIMLGTSYDGNPPAGRDGYTNTSSRPDNLPQAIDMTYNLGGINVNSAILQMFVDDFQAPVWRSQFQAQLNGQRAGFLEDALNVLSQTGPIGKLISVQIPSNFLSLVSSGRLSIYIDDPTTGAGDGYAIDFVRLLINPCLETYLGTISGTVTDANTGQPLQGATVSTAGAVESTTGSSGNYVLSRVPAGLAVVKASASGYESQTQSVDLVADTSANLDFRLSLGVATPEPTPPVTPGEIVPEAGLIAYYPFNGDTQDYSGSNNHATNNGATFTTGFDGQALNFDGSDDYVFSPVDINPAVLPEVTMIAWVKPDTDEGMTVISHDNGGFDRTIDIDTRGGGDGWSAFSGSGGVLGYHPVSINTWTFLAVSYDQDAAIVRLYVNDEVYEKSGSLGPGWDYLHVGANPSFGNSFSGVIDEVRIYNYALSGSQIGTIRDEGGIPGGPTIPGDGIPETGLIAYYPFNGDTQDYSGSGNHATNNGATFTTGIDGQGLNFDGSDDYVDSPVDINPEVMPQVTMIAWVNPDTDKGMTVISHDNGGFDRTIDIDSRGGGEGWSAFSGSGGVLGYHPVSVNTWTFLAVSYDQDAEIVRLYVNDEVYEEDGSLGSGWDYLHIGANPSFGGNFSGVIDEVRIYNYALSGSQIGTIRDEGGTPEGDGIPARGLIAYYPFNGDTQDYSGSNNHATNNGATFTTGIDGQGLNFDGSDDYVDSPVDINPEVMPQVTMIAWVKPDTDKGMTVISHDNGGFDRTIDIDSRGGGEGWSAFSGSGGVLGYYPVSVDTWTFLAVSYDQDAEIVRLYVNDEVYEESGSLGSGWDYVYIGANPSFGARFSGVIDEVRIYNYALSGTEIGTIRDEGGSPGTPAPPTRPPTGPTLTFESRSKARGSTVQIPLTLSGVQDLVGNMDITLAYNPSVLEAIEAVKGSLTENSIFDHNILNGTILISLADNRGFAGNGSVAYVRFNVIGIEGSTSPLDIVELTANRASDMALMNITPVDGIFRVFGVGDEEAIADCNGDGKLSVLDALCALQMAVGKRDVDLAMDINNDEQVTSLDARRILRVALGLETL